MIKFFHAFLDHWFIVIEPKLETRKKKKHDYMQTDNLSAIVIHSKNLFYKKDIIEILN